MAKAKDKAKADQGKPWLRPRIRQRQIDGKPWLRPRIRQRQTKARPG